MIFRKSICLKKFNRLLFHSIILVAISLIPYKVKAQHPQWAYYNNNYTNSIAEDNDAIWAGTAFGLVRLDKLSGEIFTFNKTNSPLPVNRINSVTIDADNNKWLGTEGGGLIKYDGSNWQIFDTTNSQIPTNYIYEIATDYENNVYLVALQYPELKNSLAKKVNDDDWIIYNCPSYKIYDIELDNSGVIWAATDCGIAKFDGTDWVIFNHANTNIIPYNEISGIEIDNEGILWAVTAYGCVLSYNGTFWSCFNFEAYCDDLEIDNNGVKWIACRSKLYRFYNNELTWISIESSLINTLFSDSSNFLLIGTNHGLLKYNGLSFADINISPIKLQSNIINTLVLNGNIGLWVGTDFNLTWFDGINSTIFTPYNSGLPNRIINCVTIDNSDNLWIATDGGMAKISNNNWVIFNTENSELPSNKIQTIYFEENGMQWISTRGAGLVRYDGTNWSKFVSNRYKNIVAITQDLFGIKWFCTIDSGVIKIPDVTLPTYYDTSNSGLPSNCVYSVAVDENNAKWFATANGVAQFDNTNWVTFNTSNSPLPSNLVYSIAFDHVGNKWISTSGGFLVKVDANSNWEVFSANNSCLPGCDILSITIDNNDTKWFETNGCGVVAYNEYGIPAPISVDYESVFTPATLIYPNPATDRCELHFENYQNSNYIEIFDLYGKSVLRVNTTGNRTSLDISGLASGIYIVTDNNRSFQRKLIKTGY